MTMARLDAAPARPTAFGRALSDLAIMPDAGGYSDDGAVDPRAHLAAVAKQWSDASASEAPMRGGSVRVLVTWASIVAVCVVTIVPALRIG